jgi:hypothetical protein
VQERTAELMETNHALRKSEEQFRLLFDLASIGMAITALDGKILRVNQAFVICSATAAKRPFSLLWQRCPIRTIWLPISIFASNCGVEKYPV